MKNMYVCVCVCVCMYVTKRVEYYNYNDNSLIVFLFSYYQGDTLATCDSYGIVKLWDIRTGTTRISIDCGPHPANKVAFDPAGW